MRVSDPISPSTASRTGAVRSALAAVLPSAAAALLIASVVHLLRYLHPFAALGGTWIAAAVALGALKRRADRERARRLAAESERREAEQHLHDMIEGLNAMVWEADATTWRFSFVSRHAERILGYPVERWLADADFWPDHIHPDDRAWAVETCAAATAALRDNDFEYRMIAADGRIVWLRDLVRVVADEHGRPWKLRGVMVDITARKLAEEALRAREEDFRLLFASNPQPMWVYDLETLRFLEVNEAAVAHYGYTREEFLGMRITDIRPAEEVPRLLEQLAAERSSLRGEAWRHRLRDGRLIDVEIVSHVLDFGGREAALIVAQDVTERKRMEEALRRSEEAQRRLADQRSAILDALPAHVILLDAAGTIVSANRAWTESSAAYGVLGSSTGVGESYAAACESARGDEGRLVADGIRSVLRNSMDAFELEYRSHSPGGPRSFRLMVVPVHRGRDGGAVVMHLDVTHLKWVEEERELLRDRLEQERRRLEAVLQKLPVGVLLAEAPSGRIVFGNEQVERIWRHPVIRAEGIREYTAYSSFHRDGTPLPPERHPLARAVQTGEAVAGEEIDFVRGDGTRGTMSVDASALRDADGRITAAVAAFHDITDRKQAEEALRLSEAVAREAQKLDAVGRLAGGIAHDFNNLMMVVAGYSECVLEQLGADHPLRADVEEIRAAGSRAAILTRRLLAFSRREVPSPSLLDLNALVTKLDRTLRRVVGEDIELIVRTAPNLGLVKVDPGQMEQVLLDLALNARDAMPNGGTLVIETSEVELDEPQVRGRFAVRSGRYVRLAVRDTGCGMDAATQARLFEPFFTTKEHGKGTGLGLPMVYGIVTQSEGAIDVETAPGWGTTFTIYLPRTMAGAGREETSAQPVPAAPAGGAETILLVEDEEPVRTLLGKALRRQGYTVLEARHGEEALALGERYTGPIHLLLTDVVMPRMSGPDLASRLGPTRPDMRVLYMSGYPHGAIAHHGMLPAGGALLEKPCPPLVVVLRIREMLDGRPGRAS